MSFDYDQWRVGSRAFRGSATCAHCSVSIPPKFLRFVGTRYYANGRVRDEVCYHVTVDCSRARSATIAAATLIGFTQLTQQEARVVRGVVDAGGATGPVPAAAGATGPA